MKSGWTRAARYVSVTKMAPRIRSAATVALPTVRSGRSVSSASVLFPSKPRKLRTAIEVAAPIKPRSTLPGW